MKTINQKGDIVNIFTPDHNYFKAFIVSFILYKTFENSIFNYVFLLLMGVLSIWVFVEAVKKSIHDE